MIKVSIVSPTENPKNAALVLNLLPDSMFGNSLYLDRYSKLIKTAMHLEVWEQNKFIELLKLRLNLENINDKTCTIHYPPNQSLVILDIADFPFKPIKSTLGLRFRKQSEGFYTKSINVLFTLSNNDGENLELRIHKKDLSYIINYIANSFILKCGYLKNYDVNVSFKTEQDLLFLTKNNPEVEVILFHLIILFELVNYERFKKLNL